MRTSKLLRQRALAVWVCGFSLLLIAANVHAQAQGHIVAECALSDSLPQQNDIISVAITIDMRGVQPPDDRLSAYQAKLQWDPAVLQYDSFTPAASPWAAPDLNTSAVNNGQLEWNDFVAGGVDPAKITVLTVNFKAVGAPGTSSKIDLSFSALRNSLFRDIIGLLTTHDCVVIILGTTPQPLQCALQINSPAPQTTCEDSINVTGTTAISGGVPPYNIVCEVNGVVAEFTTLDLAFAATVPLVAGENTLTAKCTVTDSKGNQSVCSAAVLVTRTAQPTATVEITAPQNGALICADSVAVSGVAEIAGLPPGVPPVSLSLDVNGVPANLSGTSFSAIVPFPRSDGLLVATLTVNDGCTEIIRHDTVHVSQPAELGVDVKIDAPVAGQSVCANSVLVTGTHTITGAVPPLSIACFVNGVTATVTGDTFTAVITLPPGVQLIEAKCTVIDACGREKSHADTVQVTPSLPVICSLKITSPPADAFVCGDSVTVAGTISITGGLAPFNSSCRINGIPAQVIGNTFTATIALAQGIESIHVVCDVSDSCGSKTMCEDSVQIKRPEPPVCEVQITSPLQGTPFCGDSITVTGTATINAGLAPFSINCFINGIPAVVVGNTFTAIIALSPGVDSIAVICSVTDSCGSQTTCKNSVQVTRPAPPLCAVQITSPTTGSFACGDSVTVHGIHTVNGGVPPFTTACSVNGVPAVVSGNSFSATIPLASNVEFIVATCIVTDSCGSESSCIDSVRIQQPSTPTTCSVQITSPQNGAMVCEDTLTVTGTASITTSVPVFPTVTSKVNGIEATMIGEEITARVALQAGNNLILVTSTFVDSCGKTVLCRDSVTVFRDNIAPTCEFKLNGTVITGSFTDAESGMKRIKPVKLKNAALTVAPFDTGDRKVQFRLDAIDPTQPMGFSIDGFDVCGNKVNCDPVALSLSSDGSRQHAFTFPSMDRYLQVNNHGLREIRIVLNEKRFALFAPANQGSSEINAYRMPSEGTVTIDLHPYLRGEESENDIFIAFDGDAGTGAEFMLMDVVQQVDHVLDLQIIPEAFHLSQNYPNPFNPSTTIRFDVPETQSGGIHVQLRVYNLLGELVRTLVDEAKLPGQHLALWDGRNEHSEVVSTGIYIYRITAGNFSETRRMTLQK